MALDRRRFLRLALVTPLALAATHAAATLGETATRLAPSLRPAGGGTSATRCAACGATGHTMLDPRCPAHPRLA
jgi:hypothetical protein